MGRTRAKTRKSRKSDNLPSMNNNNASSASMDSSSSFEPEDKRSKQDESEEINSKNDEDESCNQVKVHVQPPTPTRQEHRPKPHGRDPTKTLNIAVSSRALFNMEEEHKMFKEKGVDECIKMQLSKENEVLLPGSAFSFIKALNNVNDALKKRDPEEDELITVTLMSKNSAQVGIRLQKSIEKYPGLKIQRMSLTGGTSPVEYLEAFKITLFLTSEEKDVKEALRRGFPSAVMSTQHTNPPSETQLRVAFDLDAVLFSDESEKVYKKYGHFEFLEHEKKNRDKPLHDGPIKPFAVALGKMQKKFGCTEDKSCPIRTYLVTSRDAEVGERALKTLRHWGLQINESHFMAGAPNDEILKAINPHIFFDDQKSHIDGARRSGTPSGHVPNTSCCRTEQELAKTNLFEK